MSIHEFKIKSNKRYRVFDCYNKPVYFNDSKQLVEDYVDGCATFKRGTKVSTLNATVYRVNLDVVGKNTDKRDEHETEIFEGDIVRHLDSGNVYTVVRGGADGFGGFSLKSADDKTAPFTGGGKGYVVVGVNGKYYFPANTVKKEESERPAAKGLDSTAPIAYAPDIVTIIIDEAGALSGGIAMAGRVRVSKVYITEQDDPMSLDDCLKAFEINSRGFVCTVIVESPLKGKIYQYGNHGEYWEDHGETRGYA